MFDFSMLEKQNNSFLFSLLVAEVNQDNKEKIREMLIVKNMSLIGKVLKQKFNIKDQDARDQAFSFGVIGLIKAVDQFDVKSTIVFSTYAYYKIFYEITKFIAESSSNIIYIPQQVYRAFYLHINSPESISQEEIIEKFNIDSTTYNLLVNIVQQQAYTSLDASIDSPVDSGKTFHDLFGDDKYKSNIAQIRLRKLSQEVEEFINANFTPKEKLVFSRTVIPYMRGESHTSLADLARELKQSRQAISSTIDNARARFCFKLKSEKLPRRDYLWSCIERAWNAITTLRGPQSVK